MELSNLIISIDQSSKLHVNIYMCTDLLSLGLPIDCGYGQCSAIATQDAIAGSQQDVWLRFAGVKPGQASSDFHKCPRICSWYRVLPSMSGTLGPAAKRRKLGEGSEILAATTLLQLQVRPKKFHSL